MKKSVTEAYLLGIKDAREYEKLFHPSLEDVEQIIFNIKATMKTFSAGEVKDMLKGVLHYWQNKLKGLKKC